MQFHGQHAAFPHLMVGAISQVGITESVVVSETGRVEHLFPTKEIAAVGIQYKVSRIVREIKSRSVIRHRFVLSLQQRLVLKTETVHPFYVHDRPQKDRFVQAKQKTGLDLKLHTLIVALIRITGTVFITYSPKFSRKGIKRQLIIETVSLMR